MRVWILLGRICFWLLWPALWVYLRDTCRTRVVIKQGDRILVVKTWLGDGSWALPGGGVHAGEALRVAALREIEEETGIPLLPTELVASKVVPIKVHGFRFQSAYFTATLDQKPTLCLGRLEITEAAWLTRSQLEKAHVSPEVKYYLHSLSS